VFTEWSARILRVAVKRWACAASVMLMVAWPPGVRGQYANGVTISDWVLGGGYACASTDKGNSGTTLYGDGEAPGDAIAEWHSRVTELTIAANPPSSGVVPRDASADLVNTCSLPS